MLQRLSFKSSRLVLKESACFCTEQKQTNAGGQRELIDIGSLLRVPADKAIQAFDVQQAKDLKLYLSFATKEDDRNSKLWVVEPFLPSAVRTMTNLTPTDTGLIRKISMVSRTKRHRGSCDTDI